MGMRALLETTETVGPLHAYTGIQTWSVFGPLLLWSVKMVLIFCLFSYRPVRTCYLVLFVKNGSHKQYWLVLGLNTPAPSSWCQCVKSAGATLEPVLMAWIQFFYCQHANGWNPVFFYCHHANNWFQGRHWLWTSILTALVEKGA